MRNASPLAALFAVCWAAGCTAAVAQTTGPDLAAPAAPHAKASKPRRAAKPAPSLPPAAANLNAPSTDFSNVEPDTGEPRERRQRGSNIRPSIDSNGRPVMGLGF